MVSRMRSASVSRIWIASQSSSRWVISSWNPPQPAVHAREVPEREGLLGGLELGVDRGDRGPSSELLSTAVGELELLCQLRGDEHEEVPVEDLQARRVVRLDRRTGIAREVGDIDPPLPTEPKVLVDLASPEGRAVTSREGR